MKKDKLEKVYDLVCVSAPLSSCTIAGGTLLGLEVGTVMILSGASVLLSPFVLKGIDAVKEKKRRDKINHHDYFLQSFDNVFKPNDANEKINFETNYFYRYIFNKLSETLVPRSLFLNQDTSENINQFLYLINSNYYYSIKENNPELKRDKLIDKLLSQIISYLERSGKNTFDFKIAKKVLENCDFIDLKLKKEIINEYKRGKVSYRGKDVYSVNSRNCELGKSKKSFDINNNSDYTLIIEYVSNMKKFRNTNLKNLEWDIDSLRNVVVGISENYKSCLNCDSDLELMSSFVVSTAEYALKNKCSFVGVSEYVGGIYDYSYIPSLTIKNDIVSFLMDKGTLDDVLRDKSEVKNKEKVIAKPISK